MLQICADMLLQWNALIGLIFAISGKGKRSQGTLDLLMHATLLWGDMAMLICICDDLPLVNVTGLRRHHDTAGSHIVVFGCFLEWVYFGF